MTKQPNREKRQLMEGLDRFHCHYTEVQLERLLAYKDLLIKWNRVHNLVSTSDQHRMITRHILDSLNLYPHLQQYFDDTVFDTVLDFGTGAGLPGLPLAVMLPNIQFTLLDGSQKKIAFLHQCRMELGIRNIKPLCERIEIHQTNYPAIISRAVRPCRILIQQVSGRLQPHGAIFAMLGGAPAPEELKWLDAHADTFCLEESICGNAGETHYILLARIAKQRSAKQQAVKDSRQAEQQ